jgi:hypothetical protein
MPLALSVNSLSTATPSSRRSVFWSTVLTRWYPIRSPIAHSLDSTELSNRVQDDGRRVSINDRTDSSETLPGNGRRAHLDHSSPEQPLTGNGEPSERDSGSRSAPRRAGRPFAGPRMGSERAYVVDRSVDGDPHRFGVTGGMRDHRAALVGNDQ